MADRDLGGGEGGGFALLLFFDVVLGGGQGDQPVEDDRAEGAVGAHRRAGGRPSGRRGGGGRWVCWATRRACQAGTCSLRTRFQSRGRRWCRSRASPISWAPAAGERPRFNAKVSGVNAATAGVPSPPSDSDLVSTPRAAPPGVATPVSGVAGLEDGPLVGETELQQRGAAFGQLGLGGGGQDTGGVEVARIQVLEVLDGCRAHGTSQASSTDSRSGPAPTFTRDPRR